MVRIINKFCAWVYTVHRPLKINLHIAQVAAKIGVRVEQVILTKDKRPVDPTSMAAIYTNAKLVASARL